MRLVLTSDSQKSASLTRVAIDGSSLGNPGAGGWCWWVSEARWEAGGTPGPVSNNAMEITALLRLLQSLTTDNLSVLSDSTYVVNAVTTWHHAWRKRGWTTSSGETISNKDLIVETLDLLTQRRREGLSTKLTWVKAHNGHRLNENADQRAREIARKSQEAGRAIRLRSGEAGRSGHTTHEH